MVIYTFCPDQGDGPTARLRFINLPSDRSAKAHARAVLDTYPASRRVQIWDGERLVDDIAR
ncbi:MAG: hypothetical protein JWO72_2999 [Caulobacteraceae bacterium]|jgi:hypothetical protein|nr:hypothetical protein [Caulobacteraceae bacterium]